MKITYKRQKNNCFYIYYQNKLIFMYKMWRFFEGINIFAKNKY